MSKLIKNYRIIDNKTIELVEDASIGDCIDLSAHAEIDLSDIDEKLIQKTKSIMDKEIEKVKNDLIAQHKREEADTKEKIELRIRSEMNDRLNKLIDEKNKSDKEKSILEEKIMSETNGIKLEHQTELSKTKNEYELKMMQLQKDKEILEENLKLAKDYKFKLSTKMVGESLEQHCELEFERIGRIAFPNADFKKDNDSSTGSKGDFIYREVDENGVEILSIMFEMKNESDETKTKHKNSDFFKELDKDRDEKKCEYAILVSMLEKDNELYQNIRKATGYPKMYVIRPQCFIEIIHLLRDSSIKHFDTKQELILAKQNNLDIDTFKTRLDEFKDSFNNNSRLFNQNFDSAIDDIEKSIKAMEKTKEELLKAKKQLSAANNKLEDLTVKKLTKGTAFEEKKIK
jgi:hypothetical protein